MTREQHGDNNEGQSSTLRADYYRYDGRRRNGSDGANSIAIDKTTAMILGAIGSAAIAVAIAGGTALVQKVDDTAREVEKGRAERIAAFGEVSKNISVVETKVNQLITQTSQLEMRIERSMTHDLEIRDKRIEMIDKEIFKLQETVNDVVRDTRRQGR
jgi:uncharacterized protein YoxC